MFGWIKSNIYVVLASSLVVAGMAIFILIQQNKIDNLQSTVESQNITLAENAKTIEQCESDKALTEGVSNDYQSKIRSLNNQLGKYRGMLSQSTCIPLTGEAIGSNGSPAAGELSGRNGINSHYLIDFAGRAEETRLKLLGCQDFINKLYESRGYDGQN